MSQTLIWTDLNDADKRLVEAARDASVYAYAPYSGFAVGATVRTKSGRFHRGANLENASYGLSICAETVALAAANADGDFAIDAIAVVGRRVAETGKISPVVTPCGRCRQVILEASQRSAIDVRVLSCNSDLSVISQSAISELLPLPFGAANFARTD